jgi:hypothetical protein
MLDRRYIQFYRISFLHLKILSNKLCLSLCAHLFLYKIRKVVKIVLYILVHEIQLMLMVNLYNVSASIVCEYIDIVYDILVNKDKFYMIYNFLP